MGPCEKTITADSRREYIDVLSAGSRPFIWQSAVSKRILRQIVDLAQCLVNGSTCTICRKILLETEQKSDVRGTICC